MKILLSFMLILGTAINGYCTIMKSAYFSYSLRTPKIGSKLDYEVSGGITLKKYLDVVAGSMERDSSAIYHSLTLLTHKSKVNTKYEVLNLFNDVSGEIKINESFDLNEQLLIKELTNVYEIFQLRLINKWDTWKYITPLLGAKVDLDVGPTVTNISYDTNFRDERIFNFRYKVRWNMNTTYIEPKLIYRKATDSSFVQSKIEIGVVW